MKSSKNNNNKKLDLQNKQKPAEKSSAGTLLRVLKIVILRKRETTITVEISHDTD